MSGRRFRRKRGARAEWLNRRRRIYGFLAMMGTTVAEARHVMELEDDILWNT